MTRLSVLVRPRVLALALAAGLAVTLLPAAPASAASQKITSRFFGMTDFDPVTWPKAKVGAIRLWDSGVTWREIETSKGHFDFSRLDAQVAMARKKGAEVLLVLGQTPRFHSTKPNSPSSSAKGAAAMPTLASWKNYVGKVVRRYKGKGVDYQVWNEANVGAFWNGTPRQMATLTKLTSRVVARNDKSADVVSPALATRLTSQRKWLRDFYAIKTGGKRVGSWVDVVSLNLYPLPKQGPEASIKLLSASRSMLNALGVRKPIWNTEINYGLQTGGGGTAKAISRKRQAAYVARTYLLNADGGVKRTFWYSWGVQSLANTKMTYPTGGVARAGTAFQVVGSWLIRTRFQGCSRSSNGTYTCTAKYGKGVKRIYWNPSRTVTIRTAPSTTQWSSLLGTTTKIKGGKSLRVGYSPVMVRSRR
jgi:hypothetical protein